MKRVILHIEQLVLRGVARGDARALSTALQDELQRLLALPGGLAALQGRQGGQGVKPDQARVPQGAGPAAIGRAVAGRIVAGGKP
jgi:hypothetical protein